jgi:hypothetical protein
MELKLGTWGGGGVGESGALEAQGHVEDIVLPKGSTSPPLPLLDHIWAVQSGNQDSVSIAEINKFF